MKELGVDVDVDDDLITNYSTTVDDVDGWSLNKR